MKEKLPLVVGIGLPLLLIIYVAASYYLSSLFVQLKYDFIYTSGYSYGYDLKVVGGKITIDTYDYSTSYNRTRTVPNIYYYNARDDRSQAITLAEAQTYTLDPSTKSPDGYTVEKSSTGSIFWGSSDGYYLKGHGFNKKINVTADQYNFRFLGWVLNE